MLCCSNKQPPDLGGLAQGKCLSHKLAAGHALFIGITQGHSDGSFTTTLTSTKDQRFVDNRFIEVKNGFWSLYSNHLFPLGKFYHLFNCPFLICTMRMMRKYLPPRFAVRLTERMDVSPPQSLVHRKNPINVSYYDVNIKLKHEVNSGYHLQAAQPCSFPCSSY